ncbi:hypothetical protein ACGGZK_10945 [Agromyces sp. MMS24-K17]|uniref:hypothetical protein n=1 Tax=Agromyces sp. MMS24-K17 TaxID=3372850 RepID=UPI0037551FC8
MALTPSLLSSPSRTRAKRGVAALAAAAVITTGAIVTSQPATAATGDPLRVDFSQSTGEFRGGASGMLYGLSDDGVPTYAISAGAHPTNITQKAPHGQQHPNGDPLEIEDQFFATGGEYIMVNIQDYYPDWSYNGGKRPTDFNTYLDIVRTVVTSIKTESDHPEKYVFTPFNEPDGGNWYNNWGTMKNTFLADWKVTYETIRSIIPDAKIAGMGDTGWQATRTRDILTYARDNHVLPDMFTWHELGINNLATYRSHYDAYRQIERDLGIGPLPVNITEYAMRRDMSVPGQIIQWLAMFEDTKVDAQTAYWTYAGNLNDNMAKNNSANGAWWLLKWYGDLTGDTVALTPPQLNVVDTLQGIAAIDEDTRVATVLFGGSSSDVTLDLGTLPHDVFGSEVDIQVREAEWTGQEGEATAPRIVAADRVSTDGPISFTVPNDDRLSAYQLVITPALAQEPVVDPTWRTSVEAENTQLANVTAYAQSMGNDWLFAASGQRDVGSTNKVNSSLTWNVTVPQAGTYRLGVIAGVNGPSIGPGQHALFVDGAFAGTIDYEAGFSWGYRGRAETLVDLPAGAHQLSIRMSKDGTTLLPGSDISLDKFDLELVDGAETMAYPALLARTDGVTRFDTEGVRGSVELSDGDDATFYIAARTEGYYDLKLDYTTPAAADVEVQINGRELAGFEADAAGSWQSTARVHLAKGISEITVSTGDAIDLDRLTTVRANDGDTATIRIEAEDATKVQLAGAAKVQKSAQPTNESGSNVGFIGGGAANTMTVTRPAGTPEGQYDLSVRYANADRNTGHAYNTDVISRKLDITETGGATQREAFRHNYSWKGYWTHTVALDLTTASGSLVFSNATGSAPNIDWIALSPLVLGETENTRLDEPERSLAITAVATTRCVAGKVVVAVQATNADEVPVDLTIQTAYGSKAGLKAAAGKSVAQAFSSRLGGVPAGSATVQASGELDGTPVTTEVTAPYTAATC